MSRSGRTVDVRTGKTTTGDQGKHVHGIIDRLENATDTTDLQRAVADLVATMGRRHERLEEENAALRRRVARLEDVVQAFGAATRIIPDEAGC